jgi:hypothetical protein
MATGRLEVPLDLAATTYSTAYTCPTSTFAVATISLCNRSTASRTVRIAVTTTAGPSAPSNGEFIEYDTELLSKGVLERTGIVLQAGMRLVVWSSGNEVSVVVYGIETTTA